jgi:5-methylcytosine-specific restriction endonuclease McrA
MNGIRPKARRLRLDPVSYENLRQQVLRRDGWRCQSCGAPSNLEFHHKAFRSHAGDDAGENLITLCWMSLRHPSRATYALIATNPVPSQA